MLLFTDMRAAVAMGDQRQLRRMLDGSRYFELDQVGLRGTERFDINVHDSFGAFCRFNTESVEPVSTGLFCGTDS
jgi:hypothetical protein